MLGENSRLVFLSRKEGIAVEELVSNVKRDNHVVRSFCTEKKHINDAILYKVTVVKDRPLCLIKLFNGIEIELSYSTEVLTREGFKAVGDLTLEDHLCYVNFSNYQHIAARYSCNLSKVTLLCDLGDKNCYELTIGKTNLPVICNNLIVRGTTVGDINI